MLGNILRSRRAINNENNQKRVITFGSENHKYTTVENSLQS